MSRLEQLRRRPYLGSVIGAVAGLAGCGSLDSEERTSSVDPEERLSNTSTKTESTTSTGTESTPEDPETTQDIQVHDHSIESEGGDILQPKSINEVRYASSFDSISAALDDLPDGEWGQLVIDKINDPPYVLEEPINLSSFRVIKFREDVKLGDRVITEESSEVGFVGMFNTPAPHVEERIEHVRLIGQGGTIDANRANNSAYFWGAIDFHNIDDVWVDGLNIVNVPGPAIRIGMDNNRVRVSNNRVDRSLEGIFIMAKDGWVINNDVRNTSGGETGSGIVIGGNTVGGGAESSQVSRRVKVINNNLRDVMNGLDASNDGSHITFRDNTIQPNDGSIAIRITNTNNGQKSPSNVNIVNNYVKCIGSEDIGVMLVDAESHYLIKDNWIENAGNIGIQLGTDTINCKIVDNDVTGSGGRGIWVPPGSDDILIRGNRVWNNSQGTGEQAGITLSSSNRIQVVENTVFDDQQNPTQNWGIRDSSEGGADLILERNTVYGHQIGPFDLNATRDAYWAGNDPPETQFPDQQTSGDGTITVEWPASGRGQFIQPATKPIVDVTTESNLQWYVDNWLTGARDNYRGAVLQFTDLNGGPVDSGRTAHIRIRPNNW